MRRPAHKASRRAGALGAKRERGAVAGHLGQPSAGRLAGSSPVLVGMAARVSDTDGWRAWTRQVEHAGHCVRPVRIRGGAAAVDTATGEVRAEFTTRSEPDGTLLIACGDRRAAVCPPCAEIYRRDTWHVVAAGLRGRAPGNTGRDGVPASVAEHPVVLATFTAPSFGPVHRATTGEACQARRSGRAYCQHGNPQWCDVRHQRGNARAGTPLCWDCYDYPGHVLWHGAVPELWRRTTIYLYRAAARLASERTGQRWSIGRTRERLRFSYVKVAEYQQRAAVHLHAIIRLDGMDPDNGDQITAPPAWADTTFLEAVIRDAAGRVAVSLPAVDKRRVAVWGGQLDVAAVADPARAAAYLAKYATKTAGDVLAGLPVRRFGTRGLSRMRQRGVSPHVMLLVHTCLRLAKRGDCQRFRFGDYPHTLGFRGHFATKSRRYSITLTVLRAARRAWRAGRNGGRGDPWAAAIDDNESMVIVSDWRYLGTGWALPGDADLAATLARDHALARDAADIATSYRAG